MTHQESGMQTRKAAVNLHATLDEIAAMLEHHRALQALARGQDPTGRGVAEQLQRRQNVAELQRRVGGLHPADLAFVLEGLPPDDRLQIWTALDVRQAAEAVLELDAAARAWLVDRTDRYRLTKIAATLDPDDLALISDELPLDVMREVRRSLDEIDRSLLQRADTFPPGSVGRLMSVEVVAVRESQTIAHVLGDLQRRAELPAHMDRLFVVDPRNLLRGAVSLQALVLGKPDTPITAIMEEDPLAFRPADTAAQAARAFERYDLVSVPVVNERGKLVGRLTVDAVVDFIRVTADKDALAMAGLRRAEDLFASVWQSARNRSPWLFVNLVTAFVATRFIGLFESTIQDLVALATLMPIVASIGGNTGNQTVALVIRGLAYEQLTPERRLHLLRKEVVVSLINGVIWGGMVGMIAGLVYQRARLGMVMTGAIMLNLVIAAAIGVLVPMTLQQLERDPAQGSSVLLTFITDSMGFLIFLGLAKIFL
jgi:magnesium transporter